MPRLSLRQALKKAFGHYALFQGRSRRSEYWWYTLFVSAISSLALAIDDLSGIDFGHFFYGPVSVLVTFLLLLPSLSVSIRRLHDIGKSGWNILLVAIPFIGPVLLLDFFCSDSKSGENQYGPSVKYIKI